MSHRKKWDWVDVIWMLAALLLLAIALFPLLAPYLLQRVGTQSPATSNFLLLVEKALTGIMLMFAVLWIFFLGGTFASFLNVVASRVPHGKSILGSSHCPNCSVRINFRDNIPFVGWTRNRGRCSNCGQPISIRYLLVEVALGLIFLLIVLMEWASGGVTLPIRKPDAIADLNRMLFEPGYDLIAIVVFHLTMICVLFAFVLVELERRTIPKSILAAGIGFGSAIALIWPCSILLPWNYPFADALHPGSSLNAIISLALGLCSGAAMGWLVGRMATFASESSTVTAQIGPNLRMPNNTIQILFGLSIVGLFLGWQSVLVIGPLWWVIYSIATWSLQKSLAQKTGLPSSEPATASGNIVNQDIVSDNDVGDIQQTEFDRLGSDHWNEQLAFRMESAANGAPEVAALPHAWLLVIVLIHLSTWQWMNLLR